MPPFDHRLEALYFTGWRMKNWMGEREHLSGDRGRTHTAGDVPTLV
jgi:hypothetical protein